MHNSVSYRRARLVRGAGGRGEKTNEEPLSAIPRGERELVPFYPSLLVEGVRFT